MPRVTSNESHRKVIYIPKNQNDPPTLRYMCNQCEISVGRKADIPRHMTIHSGTFQFMCTESGCRQVGGGVGFHQLGNLKTHVADAHAPHNKYTCPHVWSHSDGSLERCPARFKNNTSLVSHRRRAHGFRSGDSPSNADTPTPVGTVFVAGEQRRDRGRRPSCNGAIIEFPAGSPDDHITEVTFVQATFANRQELERILDARGVPFPTLEFKWPQGSSMGIVRTPRSSPQSTPTPSPCESQTPSSETAGQSPVAAALAAVQAAYGQPLPCPFTTNAPTLPTLPTASGVPAAHQLGQQDTIYNAAPPAWSPTLFPPFASGSAVPQPQPAFAQGMAMAGGSMVTPQAANQAYGRTNAPPVPPHWTQANVPPVPPHWTQANGPPVQPHWSQANAYPTGGLMGPVPTLPLPFAGELDLDPFNPFNTFNAGSVPSSLPHYNDTGLGVPMPQLRPGSHVFSARSQTTLATAAAPAAAPVPTASEPYASQVPLEFSNFVHWSVRHDPSAL